MKQFLARAARPDFSDFVHRSKLSSLLLNCLPRKICKNAARATYVLEEPIAVRFFDENWRQVFLGGPETEGADRLYQTARGSLRCSSARTAAAERLDVSSEQSC